MKKSFVISILGLLLFSLGIVAIWQFQAAREQIPLTSPMEEPSPVQEKPAVREEPSEMTGAEEMEAEPEPQPAMDPVAQSESARRPVAVERAAKEKAVRKQRAERQMAKLKESKSYKDMVKQMPPPKTQSSRAPASVQDDDFLAQQSFRAKGAILETWENKLDDVQTANIAFNVPDSVMALNETIVMELLLDMDKTVQQLQERLQKRGNTETMMGQSGVEVSEVMEAKLVGSESAFRITPITPERQGLNPNGTTEWSWEVEALGEGSHRLHLTLNAIITMDDEKETRSIRRFEQVITVNVSVMSKVSGFIGKNWQWLWTVILVPLASWLWSRRKKGKAKS